MFKKKFIVVSFLFCLPLIGIVEPLPKGDRAVEIDTEISQLKQKLKENEFKEMGEETKSQDYVIADWKKYAQEVEGLKSNDSQIREIERKIQDLEKERANLSREKS